MQVITAGRPVLPVQWPESRAWEIYRLVKDEYLECVPFDCMRQAHIRGGGVMPTNAGDGSRAESVEP